MIRDAAFLGGLPDQLLGSIDKFHIGIYVRWGRELIEPSYFLLAEGAIKTLGLAFVFGGPMQLGSSALPDSILHGTGTGPGSGYHPGGGGSVPGTS